MIPYRYLGTYLPYVPRVSLFSILIISSILIHDAARSINHESKSLPSVPYHRYLNICSTKLLIIINKLIISTFHHHQEAAARQTGRYLYLHARMTAVHHAAHARLHHIRRHHAVHAATGHPVHAGHGVGSSATARHHALHARHGADGATVAHHAAATAAFPAAVALNRERFD